MAKNNYSLGMVLIAIAIVLILGKLGVFGFIGGLLWPILILALSILLHYLYQNGTVPSIALVPAGALCIYSLLFLYCNLFGWGSMKYLWPGFILGIAVGLYEWHYFERGRAPQISLTAAIILGIVSIAFFVFSLIFTIGIYFIALVLIVVGVFLVTRRSRSW